MTVEPDIMTVLRYLALGVTGYKIALPGILTLSGLLVFLIADG